MYSHTTYAKEEWKRPPKFTPPKSKEKVPLTVFTKSSLSRPFMAFKVASSSELLLLAPPLLLEEPTWEKSLGVPPPCINFSLNVSESPASSRKKSGSRVGSTDWNKKNIKI